MTRCMVRSESILTQLLFDHSLRLRMKDSLGEEEVKDIPAEGTKTPLIRIEAAEGGGPEAAMEHEDTAAMASGSATGSTLASSTSTAKGKEAAKDGDADSTKEPKAAIPGQGLAGKINVLMAADVESLVEGESSCNIIANNLGRDLPLVFVYTPIQLALCIVFLYRILSWSALIGMFIMIITLPIPGVLTKLNADYQSKRMVAVSLCDNRVFEADMFRLTLELMSSPKLSERYAC